MPINSNKRQKLTEDSPELPSKKTTRASKKHQFSDKSAPMEEKTAKILEKIKKYYEDIEKQITPKALKETSDKIRSWIARHAPEREVVKTKDFSLFNANRQPAEMSETVSRIRNQTQEKVALLNKQKEESQTKALKGRIKLS